MSKLGNGGLLGNSADLNSRREVDEQHPRPGRTRTTRSALGVIQSADQQALTGAGGAVGAVGRPHSNDGPSKGRQAP